MTKKDLNEEIVLVGEKKPVETIQVVFCFFAHAVNLFSRQILTIDFFRIFIKNSKIKFLCIVLLVLEQRCRQRKTSKPMNGHWLGSAIQMPLVLELIADKLQHPTPKFLLNCRL